MSPQHSDEPDRDDRLAAALSDLPAPDHGPTFWADLDHRLQGESVHQIESGQLHQAPPTNTGPADPTPPSADTVRLEDRRARRSARHRGLSRPLGAAAAVVALVVAVAGAVTVVRQDDKGTDIRAADRPTGTTGPGAATIAAPAEFSATYDGIEGWDGPDGCCSQYRLTVARDGSYRWTSTDGGADMAYDATTGRHVEIVTRGVGASKEHPNAFVSTGVPAGGPDHRVARPDPLRPIADFVTALARAGDPGITTRTVAGRTAWHYDGPTVQDRLGGDGAPNHAVADVDQATGVLLQLTTRVDELVINRFTASDITISDEVDRARYRLDPPPGADIQDVLIGFLPTAVPGDALVPTELPDGATLDWGPSAVTVNRDVAAPTGPEGANPPTKPVVSMTWRYGAQEFTVTLRPTGGQPEWNDPLGAEGMVPAAKAVRLELSGRPALEGQVVVDGPLQPHLWGITGDIVVTVSGDLTPTELERVAGSLRPHRAG